MNLKFLGPAAVLSSAFLAISATSGAAAAIREMPLGQRINVSGIETACAGIGIGARKAPQWTQYRVKFEATGGYGQYLTGEDLSVTRPSGKTVVRVGCRAPWIMMQLPAGKYSATMSVTNAASQHVSFTVPEHGQRDVIIRFPNRMAGEPASRRVAQNAKGASSL